MRFTTRGAWLAPRSTAGLDSESARDVLAEMRSLGVTHVAIGHDVTMPTIAAPELTWGAGDDGLRIVLRAIRAAGMHAFLLPRIESPDFFEPPYPFRADIEFGDDVATWERFHACVERMLLHYAALAAEERVAVFGVGLELKHSVKRFDSRWREMIGRVRGVFPGALTYSANWYDEWEDVPFWDALDYIGVGAYFELAPNASHPDPVQAIAESWQPIAERLAALSRHVGRPVLFTEIGYTGYADCVERPWEWAGKQGGQTAIDHARQARAYAGLFRALGDAPWLDGMFVWTFYAGPTDIADWEYALQGRPAVDVLRAAYR